MFGKGFLDDMHGLEFFFSPAGRCKGGRFIVLYKIKGGKDSTSDWIRVLAFCK